MSQEHFTDGGMRPTERSKLLQEAEGIVNKDRNSVYGNPEDNFKDIAELWAAYKGCSFSSMDVVVMNMLIKVARLKKTPGYRDGLVDIAGYAACGADIQYNMAQRTETVQDILHSQHYDKDRNR